MKLIERIVLSSSAPGDLVVDPFLGSGTTAVVAQLHGRRWLGIERDADYVKLARQRLRQTMQQARGKQGKNGRGGEIRTRLALFAKLPKHRNTNKINTIGTFGIPLRCS